MQADLFSGWFPAIPGGFRVWVRWVARRAFDLLVASRPREVSRRVFVFLLLLAAPPTKKIKKESEAKLRAETPSPAQTLNPQP